MNNKLILAKSFVVRPKGGYISWRVHVLMWMWNLRRIGLTMVALPCMWMWYLEVVDLMVGGLLLVYKYEPRRGRGNAGGSS